LPKANFVGKNTLPSEYFESSVFVQVTIVEGFCNFGHNVFKKQPCWLFFYKDIGHKLRKISGNSVLQWLAVLRWCVLFVSGRLNIR